MMGNCNRLQNTGGLVKIMMNKRIILSLVSILILAFGIDFRVAAKEREENSLTHNSITANKISFDQVSIEDAPDRMVNLINIYKRSKGFVYYTDDANGYVYIGILMGEKSTGGYSVKVTEVQDNEGKTDVFVQEICPSADAIVTQVITYPYIIIRAKGITTSITVTGSFHAYYKNLMEDEKAIDDVVNTEENTEKNWIDIKPYSNVSQNKVWTIKFNKSTVSAILNKETVYVRDMDGKKVDAELAHGEDSKTVLVKPSAEYKSGNTYYLFVSNKINGNDNSKSSDNKGFRMKFTVK